MEDNNSDNEVATDTPMDNVEIFYSSEEETEPEEHEEATNEIREMEHIKPMPPTWTVIKQSSTNTMRAMRKWNMKQIMILIMILSAKSVTAEMNMMKANEFSTGIHEMEEHKIAYSNEIYDFLIPVDIQAYKEARKDIENLNNDYEQARMRFHKKKLDPSAYAGHNDKRSG